MLKGREIKDFWVYAPMITRKYLSQNNWNENCLSKELYQNEVPLKCLGRVEDLLFNFYGAIEGFFVATNGIWKNIRFLPVAEITGIHQDYLCVQSEKSLQRIRKDILARGCQNWLGAKVFTAEGKDFATVTDVILSFPFTHLTGLEISQGIMDDLQNGRKFLPWKEIVTIEQQSVMTNKSDDSFLQ